MLYFPGAMNYGVGVENRIVLAGGIIHRLETFIGGACGISIFDYRDAVTGRPIMGGPASKRHELGLAAPGTCFANVGGISDCWSTEALPGVFVTANRIGRWDTNTTIVAKFECECACPNGMVIQTLTGSAVSARITVEYTPLAGAGSRKRHNARVFDLANPNTIVLAGV